MNDNKWTATTSTSWIWFDEAKTLKAITGEGGQDIRIYVDEATEPTANLNGTITIKANGTTFTKEINRCSPTVVGTTNTLDFKIDFTQIYGGLAGPCENGKSAADPNGVKIRNIKLTTVETYSNGNSKTTEKPLNESDVNIKYILPNDESYNVLPSNKEQDREVNVKLELKQNTSIYAPTADQKREDITTPYKYKFTQQGIKDVNGNYIEDRLHDIGYSSESTDIRNFDISPSCKDQLSSSCSAGKYAFDVQGQNVTVFGAKTGLTECGERVTIGGVEEESHNISASDVIFSVSPTQSQYASFVGNELHYSENNSRTMPRRLYITATYGGHTAETTYTVIASNECGDPIYIVARCKDKEYIDYAGGTATFTYYLSYSENGGENSAITDENINSCLEFSKLAPSGLGVTIVETQKNNGVFSTKVQFIQNNNNGGEDGINWVFRIKCDTAENGYKDISIYQANAYENLIPSCDYFLFRYEWTDANGRDLDSLTHITNTRLIDSNSNDLSGVTVGYYGTAYVKDEYNSYNVYGNELGENRPYMKFGRDNMCNGSEYTIICLRNILESGEISNNDTIYVDIYANWRSEKRNGNISIIYDQYSGTTNDHIFNEEILTEVKEDCVSTISGVHPYNKFSPEQGTIKVAESVSITGINVNASGTDNASEVYRDISKIGTLYTHVLRLKYVVASKITTYIKLA